MSETLGKLEGTRFTQFAQSTLDTTMGNPPQQANWRRASLSGETQKSPSATLRRPATAHISRLQVAVWWGLGNALLQIIKGVRECAGANMEDLDVDMI